MTLRARAGWLIKTFDRLKGPRNMRLITVNNNPHESYVIQLTGGASMTIHCAEKLYKVTYSKWWATAKYHHVYEVYGACTGDVPPVLALSLHDGFRIGRLLPRFATSSDQKKEAIHAFMSMIAADMSQKPQMGSWDYAQDD